MEKYYKANLKLYACLTPASLLPVTVWLGGGGEKAFSRLKSTAGHLESAVTALGYPQIRKFCIQNVALIVTLLIFPCLPHVRLSHLP